MTDYWAHRYFEDPKLMDEIEDEGFDMDAIMAEWEADSVGESEPEQSMGLDDWETLE